MLYTLVAAGLLAVTTQVQASDFFSDSSQTHQLVKRDPSYVQATRALQNCVLKNINYHHRHDNGEKYCNSRIQMAECHVNSR
jgi:hypothetical protein